MAPRDDAGEHGFRELFERAPFGYLTTLPSGLIVSVNQTFLDWTGYTSAELVERRSFADLLTAGGRIYHETHYSPALQLQGSVREIAIDIVCRDQRRIPALVNAVLERDATGQPSRVQIAVIDATERRLYERELLAAKRRAEESESRATLLATTLQQTLIPNEIPIVPGLDIAAAYQPAGAGDEIGGDFYDVFRVDRDNWLLAVGDIEGKGVGAAIVTALTRYTIRAAAVEHSNPSDILRVLNEVLLHNETSRFCTAVLVRFRRTGADWGATVSCAGHPLPILTTDDGTAVDVGRPGTLLGLFETISVHDIDVQMPPSSTMTVYSDGVSEARRDSEFFSEERICDFLRQAGADGASKIAAGLMENVLSFGGDVRSDDATIVVAQTSPRD